MKIEKMHKSLLIAALFAAVAFWGWQQREAVKTSQTSANNASGLNSVKPNRISSSPNPVDFTDKPSSPPQQRLTKPLEQLLQSAKTQTALTRAYDPAYEKIAYPNGDVAISKGVCSDVVVRAFRAAGIDLQIELHEDMQRNFKHYPNKWGLKAPDTNIDHRRVANLQTFFKRKGKSLPVSYKRDDYLPGDVVTWYLDGYGLAHIGLVSDSWSEAHERYLIIHNIGGGAKAEDRLFDWRITGHYRYF